MASGFIILQDGRCLAVRQALHDAVLRSVASALPAGGQLRAWLDQQLPREGDVELGYAFIRSGGEYVDRTLDFRGLTAENRSLFVSAARVCEAVAGEYAPAADVAACLLRFRAMLDGCERGDPPLALSDWRIAAPPCESRIGPGWGDPA